MERVLVLVGYQTDEDKTEGRKGTGRKRDRGREKKGEGVYYCVVLQFAAPLWILIKGEDNKRRACTRPPKLHSSSCEEKRLFTLNSATKDRYLPFLCYVEGDVEGASL